MNGIWTMDESKGGIPHNRGDSMTYTGNTVTGGQVGILLSGLDRASVVGNTIKGASRYGVFATSTTAAVISGNVCACAVDMPGAMVGGKSNQHMLASRNVVAPLEHRRFYMGCVTCFMCSMNVT